jgi:AbrB family looped-hinge helix DNA binding protein
MNVRLSQKGWVVIPAAMRAKYGLKPGANLQVVDYGGVLAIVPAFANPVRDGAGLLKGSASLTRTLLDEHRQERDHESR